MKICISKNVKWIILLGFLIFFGYSNCFAYDPCDPYSGDEQEACGACGYRICEYDGFWSDCYEINCAMEMVEWCEGDLVWYQLEYCVYYGAYPTCASSDPFFVNCNIYEPSWTYSSPYTCCDYSYTCTNCVDRVLWDLKCGLEGDELACIGTNILSSTVDKNNCSLVDGQCGYSSCLCSSGPCCSDGCNFDSSSKICDVINSEYSCPWGTACGNDVGVRSQYQYCSGNSASCTGVTSWSSWSVADNCTSEETCTYGDSTCNYNAASCVCQCSTGSCCDGCNYISSSNICNTLNTEYDCYSGTDCGDDVFSRSQYQYCSGSSASCNGSISWSGWSVYDNCTSLETCAPGDASCNTDAGCSASCTGSLNTSISGSGTCTVTAGLTASSCTGKAWQIKDSGGTIKCSGTVSSSPYSYTCSNWQVTTGSYTYNLFIDGIQKDSKLLSCLATTYNLTVGKIPSAGGTVTSTPSGINCGSTCSYNFNSGTLVTLNAGPASGYTFAGWSGSCSGTGSCVLTMNSNKSATATFSVTGSFDFSISANPVSGTVNPGESLTSTISTVLISGTTQSVSFSASPAITGVTYGFSPASCGPTCDSILTINTSLTTPLASYAINVCAIGGGQNHCFVYNLTVTNSGSIIGPPEVTTNPATVITANSATLNGTLNNLGYSLGTCPDCSAMVWFDWGTTTSYGNKTPYVFKSTTGDFSANISDLEDGTTYFFKANARNGGSW